MLLTGVKIIKKEKLCFSNKLNICSKMWSSYFKKFTQSDPTDDKKIDSVGKDLTRCCSEPSCNIRYIRNSVCETKTAKSVSSVDEIINSNSRENLAGPVSKPSLLSSLFKAFSNITNITKSEKNTQEFRVDYDTLKASPKVKSPRPRIFEGLRKSLSKKRDNTVEKTYLSECDKPKIMKFGAYTEILSEESSVDTDTTSLSSISEPRTPILNIKKSLVAKELSNAEQEFLASNS